MADDVKRSDEELSADHLQARTNDRILRVPNPSYSNTAPPVDARRLRRLRGEERGASKRDHR